MPLAPLARPSYSTAKSKGKATQPQVRKKGSAPAQDDDEDEETTTDDSSDEETALEMDGQELWTQTYCATCDCLVEPGQGIAKADGSVDALSPTPHTTLKSRSGTIKARTSSNTSDQPLPPVENVDQTLASDATANVDPSNLKRTHSAGRLQARAGAGPLGPHKRTGSAGSRLNALSELRPTTKLHEDKGKTAKAKMTQDTAAPKGRKSPALSRPSSAASSKSQSNSSGPSSFKSNDAAMPGNNQIAPSKSKSRGFLGGLTPAALKQQQAEMVSKRNAPLPLYCSERCRLIDERRSSGLGELAQYLSQPLAPSAPPTWAPAPMWPRNTSMSSVPLAYAPGTPESECMCPECLDKYAEGGSAGGATIPSGASDTATESSSGYVYGRLPVNQKPRTASGRMVTPLNLYAPDGGSDSYFPSPLPYKQVSTLSPRLRPVDAVRESIFPPQSPSAASAGKASASGTDGSGISSESGSSLWEPRMKHHSDSHAKRRSSPSRVSNRQRSSTANSFADMTSGQTTTTATPALTPRHSMISTPLAASSNTARAAHRLSVPVFGPTREVDEESQHQHLSDQPSAANLSKSFSSLTRTHSALGTGPLSLLHKGRQHHAAPSVDVFSDHVGSPGARGSLLSRSLASEHTLVGASSITLSNQQNHLLSTPASREHQESRSFSRYDTAASDSSYAGDIDRFSAAKRPISSARSETDAFRCATSDELSLAVGSLRLAQSRADSSTSSLPRRTKENADKRSVIRRQSFFGTVAPERRDSNAQSIASSGSGSTSGWLRSLSSAWLSWRSTASPAPMPGDSDNQSAMESSGEWRSHTDRSTRRESDASRGNGPERYSESQKYALKDSSNSTRGSSPARSDRGSMSLSPRPPSRDRSAGITPTQSLVAKPTIRRGSVPAYVHEIGHGDIPGDATEHKGHDTASSSLSNRTGLSDPSIQRKVRTDGASPDMDEERRRRYLEKKEAKHRRSRDIAVLPPLLAPPSRSGSSTNLYGQMPRSARAYSTGRAQMYVGSAGSGHAPGNVPPSPNVLRSPYHSSFALAQDASKATTSPARPTSAAGYHALPYGAGTSPRTKGLGWGAMTSIAPQPLVPIMPSHPHQHGQPAQLAHHPRHGQHHSISYGHAAALAARGVQAQHDFLAHNPHGHRHHHHQHAQQVASGQANALHHPTVRHKPTKPALERHSTTPALVTLRRSPTPSVPEDGGEMTSQDLTSGSFISRPNSAMAAPQQAQLQQARHHRSSLMPPPRSRSSQSVRHHGHALQPTTPISSERGSNAHDSMVHPRPHRPSQASDGEEPHRTWSYDRLSGGGLKTYPILQLPDRETHDIYDPGWGLGAGGLAKHLGATSGSTTRQTEFAPKDGPAPTNHTEADSPVAPLSSSNSSVQKGFQPHRKKLFYFDA